MENSTLTFTIGLFIGTNDHKRWQLEFVSYYSGAIVDAFWELEDQVTSNETLAENHHWMPFDAQRISQFEDVVLKYVDNILSELIGIPLSSF